MVYITPSWDATFPCSISRHSEECRCQKKDWRCKHLAESLPKTYASFGIGICLAVEQSSLENWPSGGGGDMHRRGRRLRRHLYAHERTEFAYKQEVYTSCLTYHTHDTCKYVFFFKSLGFLAVSMYVYIRRRDVSFTSDRH